MTLFTATHRPSVYLLILLTGALLMSSCSADSNMDEEEEKRPDGIPAQILLTPDTLSFTSFNETQVITATVLDEHGNDVQGSSLEWTTTNDQVIALEIRDNRSVRARSVADGETTIQVTVSGLTESASIRVEQRVAGINFSPETPALEYPGDTLTLSGIARDAMGNEMTEAALNWITEASNIVTVDLGGLVTAHSFGAGSVRVESDGSTFAIPVEVLGNQYFLNDQIRLRYTLRVPISGTPPYPALIFIHGSGMITREQLTPFITPFTRAGIAVLVYDKRGVGESTGAFFNIGPQNSDTNLGILASDAANAARFLKHFPEIDTTRIGLIANSQGGWIAPITASISPDISYMMMWSGTTASVGLEIFYSNLADGTQTPLDQVYMQLDGFNGMNGFDPVPVLETLDIPAIWLFGGQDRSIPSRLDSTNIGRLRAEGKPFEYIWYPDANHALQEPPQGQFVALWTAYLEWMGRQGIN